VSQKRVGSLVPVDVMAETGHGRQRVLRGTGAGGQV